MAASSSCGSATGGSQRTSWTDDEVHTLIRVWEDHLGGLRRTTHNRKVYIAITAKLESYGITKPVKAVKGKIENLGNTYRRLNRTLGTGSPQIKWIFYKAIHKFLHTLATNDTSLTAESECGNETVEKIIDRMQCGYASADEDEGLAEDAGAVDAESHVLLPVHGSTTACPEGSAPAAPQLLQAVPDATEARQPPRRKEATQRTLLSQLVDEQRQLRLELREHRRQEIDFRKAEHQMLKESIESEKALTAALVQYLNK